MLMDFQFRPADPPSEPYLFRSIITNRCPTLDAPDKRQVKQSIRAWKTDLLGEQEHIPTGAIAPVGEQVVIEPFEEIHVLHIKPRTGPIETSLVYLIAQQ